MMQNAAKRYTMLQNVTKCYKMLRNVADCCNMLKMLEHIAKCCNLMRIFTTCCNVMQTAAPQAPENGHPHAPQDGQTQVPQDQWQQWWQQQWWQEQWSLGLPKKTINNFNQVYVTKLAKLVVVVVPHPETLPETEAALAPETSQSMSRLGGMREAKTI